MAKILSLVNMKGGIGRTTLCLHLAGAFADKGHSILMIDMEGQASATKFWLGPDTTEGLLKQQTIAAIFDDRLDPDPASIIQDTHCDNISIAPSNKFLSDHNHPKPETMGVLQTALRDFLLEVKHRFQIVVIDTPPDIHGLLCWAALVASDYLLSPVQPESFAIQGLSEVQRIHTKVLQSANPNLQFIGYLINLREKRPVLHNTYEANLRKMFADQVLKTVVPKKQPYSDAIPHQKPITIYEPRSEAATIIRKVADEVLTRMGVTAGNSKKSKSSKPRKRKAA